MGAKGTECSKCGAPMPPVKPSKGMFASLPFTLTGYRCGKCEHWNDLTRRKWYKEKIKETP